MDFDGVLPEVGGFGRQQKLLFALLCFPICFTLPFAFMGQLFMSLSPHHWCRVPELEEAIPSSFSRRTISIPLETKDGITEHSGCEMYDLNYTEVATLVRKSNISLSLKDILHSLDIRNVSSISTTSCQHGWDYDTINFRPTATSEFNWVCKDDWRPYVTLAIFFVGSSIGTILFGVISDKFGRVPTVLIVNAFACIATICTAFTNGFATFAAVRFLVGMTFDTTHMALYILALEYTISSKRTLVANMSLAMFFSTGSAILPWMAYFLPNWRLFTIVTGIPFAIILCFFRFLPESSRWLASKGRIQDSVKVLQRIAHFNRKKLSDDFESRIKQKFESSLKSSNINCTLFDVFRKRRLCLRAVMITVAWTVTMLCYDGLVRNTENLGYNVFISSTLGNLTELPAAFFPILFMDRIGRKFFCILSYFLSATLCFATIAVPTGMTSVYVTLATLARLETTVLMNALLQFCSEFMPTVVRGQVMAMTHVIGFVGSILSPFVVYLGHQNRDIPFMIFGGASLLGATAILFLPETLSEVLPDTLEEGETFGSSQPILPFYLWTEARRKKLTKDTAETPNL